MKKFYSILLYCFLVLNNCVAQTQMKEYKAGHVFNVSIPDYMNQTVGLNSSASIQFKNPVKDVYGFIIADTKDELQLAAIKYASPEEYFENFSKDLFADDKKARIEKTVSREKGTLHFVECEVVSYSKEAKMNIYYLLGAVETPVSYYKILTWCTVENKDKYKADFQNILYSIHE